MKILWKDGYARETVADRLVAEGIRNRREGVYMLEALRASVSRDQGQWYELVEDDHVLGRGMADLV